jgi:hypothetical protein
MPMRKGIALVEVLVSIAAVALVSGIVYVMTEEPREKARESLCATNLSKIYNSLQMYSEDNQGPEQMPGLGTTKFMYTASALTNYISDRKAMICPNISPKTLKKRPMFSSYLLCFVLPAMTKDTRILKHIDEIKDSVKREGPNYSLAICNTHDETYYQPRETNIDPTLAHPYQIRLLLSGKVIGARYAERRIKPLIFD